MADFISINPTTWESVPKDDPRDRVEAIVGDDKQAEFYPQVKIQRWDNEVNFSVRLITPDKITAPILDKEKIVWDSPTCGMEFSDIAPCEEYREGAFKFEYVLKSKPATNQLRFSIETKGLEFHKQPSYLTLQRQWEADFGRRITVTENEVLDRDGKTLVFCEPNVVGGYAVYHSSPPKNYADGKLYRCGQLGFIYKPRIIDSAGKWTWGELDIDVENKTYIITIPQKFIDEAVYPIRSNDTFGYETLGGNETALTSWSLGSVVDTYSATAGDEITKYTLGCVGYSDGTTINVIAYTFSGGQPATRLNTPVTINVVNGAAQFVDSGAISHTLAATDYCLAAGEPNNNGGSDPKIRFNVVSNNVSKDTSVTLPATWTHNAFTLYRISIYATYTPAGGGDTELVVSSMNIGLTLEALTLSQLHNLTVAGMDVGLSLETPVLSQLHNLSVNSMDCGLVLGSPTLTQLHNLVVASMDIALTFGTPTLNQLYTLAVASMDVGLTLASPALTQLHNLIVASIDIASTLGSPTLTQLHNLVVASVDVGLTLGAPVLNQLHTLIVASMDIASTFGEPVLNQLYTLIVEGMNLGISLEAPVLTQLHILSINGVNIALNFDNVLLDIGDVTLIVDGIDIGLTLEELILSMSTAQVLFNYPGKERFDYQGKAKFKHSRDKTFTKNIGRS